MQKEKINILIVEDEAFDVERIINTLEPFKDLISIKEIVSSGNDALALVRENRNLFDVIILDYQISGGLYGTELIAEIKKIDPSIQIIIVTKMTLNQTDLEFASGLLRKGASWFGTKNPVDIEDYIYQPTDFLLAIRNAFEKRQLQIEKSALITERDATLNKLENNILNILRQKKIIGESEETGRIRFFISKYTDVDANILITGESGTGKELVATHLHYLSKRRLENFVTVNCSAIPESLFESEFFGYTKGAFTDAKLEKAGFFEQADNGTLFLDEVGDLSLNNQAKLLRALESGEIEKIGRKKKHKVDVRVISATNKNLARMVRENRFREDLFYRLNILNINIPPLRERKEDIATMIDHFLNHYSRQYNVGKPDVSPEASEFFREFDWTGNTRQLKNLVLRMLLLQNGVIDMQVVRMCLGDQVKKELNEMEKFTPDKNSVLPLKEAEHNFRLNYVKTVRSLFTTDAEAARNLGMAKSNFHRLLKELDLK